MTYPGRALSAHWLFPLTPAETACPRHGANTPPPHPDAHAHPPLPTEIKGQDPQSNDLTNTQALDKAFGVNAAIISSLAGVTQDKEDLAVGSGGLSSGRDRRIDETTLPKDASRWTSVDLPCSRVENNPLRARSSVKIWLPKDRATVNRIVQIYFGHLNYNRPALDQADFERSLNELYDGHITTRHNQGFICTMYLVLALGTLNDSNRRANKLPEGQTSPAMPLMPDGWPNHSEFFEWGLFYKPEIQATISALQALILLHWYLYIERQRPLMISAWISAIGCECTKCSLQSLSCPERRRLGRGVFEPLGAMPSGRPSRIDVPRSCTITMPQRRMRSWHSSSVKMPCCVASWLSPSSIARRTSPPTSRQSVRPYTPSRLSADTVMRHASRIVKGLVEFKRQPPERYRRYFKYSENLPHEQRLQLVHDVTKDEGLTLLKLGICRILLLRVLFNSETLPMVQRQRALADAVVTTHNIIIIIHNVFTAIADTNAWTSFPREVFVRLCHWDLLIASLFRDSYHA
ncbi:hypothetical protein HWV62_19191 [Athelia sp. TMB]|nr:hypothetical protein HWV62_19191 [Athelia sp. TMB]